LQPAQIPGTEHGRAVHTAEANQYNVVTLDQSPQMGESRIGLPWSTAKAEDRLGGVGFRGTDGSF
jgi:hypothetical protein